MDNSSSSSSSSDGNEIAHLIPNHILSHSTPQQPPSLSLDPFSSSSISLDDDDDDENEENDSPSSTTTTTPLKAKAFTTDLSLPDHRTIDAEINAVFLINDVEDGLMMEIKQFYYGALNYGIPFADVTPMKEDVDPWRGSALFSTTKGHLMRINFIIGQFNQHTCTHMASANLLVIHDGFTTSGTFEWDVQSLNWITLVHGLTQQHNNPFPDFMMIAYNGSEDQKYEREFNSFINGDGIKISIPPVTTCREPFKSDSPGWMAFGIYGALENMLPNVLYPPKEEPPITSLFNKPVLQPHHGLTRQEFTVKSIDGHDLTFVFSKSFISLSETADALCKMILSFSVDDSTVSIHAKGANGDSPLLFVVDNGDDLFKITEFLQQQVDANNNRNDSIAEFCKTTTLSGSIDPSDIAPAIQKHLPYPKNRDPTTISILVLGKAKTTRTFITEFAQASHIQEALPHIVHCRFVLGDKLLNVCISNKEHLIKHPDCCVVVTNKTMRSQRIDHLHQNYNGPQFSWVFVLPDHHQSILDWIPDDTFAPTRKVSRNVAIPNSGVREILKFAVDVKSSNLTYLASTVLDLSNSPLQPIEHPQFITTLVLDNCQIDDAMLESLLAPVFSAAWISVLCLSNNSITDNGLQFLDLSTLIVLDLSHNQLQAPILADVDHLISLSLAGNPISDDGWEILINQCPPSLIHLNLSHISLANPPEILQNWFSNSTIRNWKLHHCLMSDETFLKFVEKPYYSLKNSLKNLLDVSHNNISPDALCRFISHMEPPFSRFNTLIAHHNVDDIKAVLGSKEHFKLTDYSLTSIKLIDDDLPFSECIALSQDFPDQVRHDITQLVSASKEDIDAFPHWDCVKDLDFPDDKTHPVHMASQNIPFLFKWFQHNDSIPGNANLQTLQIRFLVVLTDELPDELTTAPQEVWLPLLLSPENFDGVTHNAETVGRNAMATVVQKLTESEHQCTDLDGTFISSISNNDETIICDLLTDDMLKPGQDPIADYMESLEDLDGNPQTWDALQYLSKNALQSIIESDQTPWNSMSDIFDTDSDNLHPIVAMIFECHPIDKPVNFNWIWSTELDAHPHQSNLIDMLVKHQDHPNAANEIIHFAIHWNVATNSFIHFDDPKMPIFELQSTDDMTVHEAIACGKAQAHQFVLDRMSNSLVEQNIGLSFSLLIQDPIAFEIIFMLIALAFNAWKLYYRTKINQKLKLRSSVRKMVDQRQGQTLFLIWSFLEWFLVPDFLNELLAIETTLDMFRVVIDDDIPITCFGDVIRHFHTHGNPINVPNHLLDVPTAIVIAEMLSDGSASSVDFHTVDTIKSLTESLEDSDNPRCTECHRDIKERLHWVNKEDKLMCNNCFWQSNQDEKIVAFCSKHTFTVQELIALNNQQLVDHILANLNDENGGFLMQSFEITNMDSQTQHWDNPIFQKIVQHKFIPRNDDQKHVPRAIMPSQVRTISLPTILDLSVTHSLRISELDCSGVPLTTDDLMALVTTKLPPIQTINLSGCELQDNHALVLAQMQNAAPTSLDLSHNRFSFKGIQKILRKAAFLPSLKTLRLHDNNISDDPMDQLVLLMMGQSWKGAPQINTAQLFLFSKDANVLSNDGIPSQLLTLRSQQLDLIFDLIQSNDKEALQSMPHLGWFLSQKRRGKSMIEIAFDHPDIDMTRFLWMHINTMGVHAGLLPILSIMQPITDDPQIMGLTFAVELSHTMDAARCANTSQFVQDPHKFVDLIVPVVDQATSSSSIVIVMHLFESINRLVFDSSPALQKQIPRLLSLGVFNGGMVIPPIVHFDEHGMAIIPFHVFAHLRSSPQLPDDVNVWKWIQCFDAEAITQSIQDHPNTLGAANTDIRKLLVNWFKQTKSSIPITNLVDVIGQLHQPSQELIVQWEWEEQDLETRFVQLWQEQDQADQRQYMVALLCHATLIDEFVAQNKKILDAKSLAEQPSSESSSESSDVPKLTDLIFEQFPPENHPMDEEPTLWARNVAYSVAVKVFDPELLQVPNEMDMASDDPMEHIAFHLLLSHKQFYGAQIDILQKMIQDWKDENQPQALWEFADLMRTKNKRVDCLFGMPLAQSLEECFPAGTFEKTPTVSDIVFRLYQAGDIPAFVVNPQATISERFKIGQWVSSGQIAKLELHNHVLTFDGNGNLDLNSWPQEFKSWYCRDGVEYFVLGTLDNLVKTLRILGLSSEVNMKTLRHRKETETDSEILQMIELISTYSAAKSCTMEISTHFLNNDEFLASLTGQGNANQAVDRGVQSVQTILKSNSEFCNQFPWFDMAPPEFQVTMMKCWIDDNKEISKRIFQRALKSEKDIHTKWLWSQHVSSYELKKGLETEDASFLAKWFDDRPLLDVIKQCHQPGQPLRVLLNKNDPQDSFSFPKDPYLIIKLYLELGRMLQSGQIKQAFEFDAEFVQDKESGKWRPVEDSFNLFQLNALVIIGDVEMMLEAYMQMMDDSGPGQSGGNTFRDMHQVWTHSDQYDAREKKILGLYLLLLQSSDIGNVSREQFSAAANLLLKQVESDPECDLRETLASIMFDHLVPNELVESHPGLRNGRLNQFQSTALCRAAFVLMGLKSQDERKGEEKLIILSELEQFQLDQMLLPYKPDGELPHYNGMESVKTCHRPGDSLTVWWNWTIADIVTLREMMTQGQIGRELRTKHLVIPINESGQPQFDQLIVNQDMELDPLDLLLIVDDPARLVETAVAHFKNWIKMASVDLSAVDHDVTVWQTLRMMDIENDLAKGGVDQPFVGVDRLDGSCESVEEAFKHINTETAKWIFALSATISDSPYVCYDDSDVMEIMGRLMMCLDTEQFLQSQTFDGATRFKIGQASPNWQTLPEFRGMDLVVQFHEPGMSLNVNWEWTFQEAKIIRQMMDNGQFGEKIVIQLDDGIATFLVGKGRFDQDSTLDLNCLHLIKNPQYLLELVKERRFEFDLESYKWSPDWRPERLSANMFDETIGNTQFTDGYQNQIVEMLSLISMFLEEMPGKLRESLWSVEFLNAVELCPANTDFETAIRLARQQFVVQLIDHGDEGQKLEMIVNNEWFGLVPALIKDIPMADILDSNFADADVVTRFHITQLMRQSELLSMLETKHCTLVEFLDEQETDMVDILSKHFVNGNWLTINWNQTTEERETLAVWLKEKLIAGHIGKYLTMEHMELTIHENGSVKCDPLDRLDGIDLMIFATVGEAKDVLRLLCDGNIDIDNVSDAQMEAIGDISLRMYHDLIVGKWAKERFGQMRFDVLASLELKSTDKESTNVEAMINVMQYVLCHKEVVANRMQLSAMALESLLSCTFPDEDRYDQTFNLYQFSSQVVNHLDEGDSDVAWEMLQSLTSEQVKAVISWPMDEDREEVENLAQAFGEQTMEAVLERVHKPGNSINMNWEWVGQEHVWIAEAVETQHIGFGLTMSGDNWFGLGDRQENSIRLPQPIGIEEIVVLASVLSQHKELEELDVECEQEVGHVPDAFVAAIVTSNLKRIRIGEGTFSAQGNLQLLKFMMDPECTIAEFESNSLWQMHFKRVCDHREDLGKELCVIEFASERELEKKLNRSVKDKVSTLILVDVMERPGNEGEDLDLSQSMQERMDAVTVTELPTIIERFAEHLKWIDLAMTEIESLPPGEFGKLKQLEGLGLRSVHSLSDVPSVVVEKGAQDVVAYLAKMTEDWKWNNWMVVGHGGQGKSTMIGTLHDIHSSRVWRNVSAWWSSGHAKQKLNSERTTQETHSLDVIEINEDGMHYRISDYAGQTEYYVTHQYLLMGQSGVYVIVTSAVRYDQEQGKHVVDLPGAAEEFAYWLQIIRSKVSRYTAEKKKPRIILVLTKADLAKQIDKGFFSATWSKKVLEAELVKIKADVYSEFKHHCKFVGQYVVDGSDNDSTMKGLFEQLTKESGKVSRKVPKGQVFLQSFFQELRRNGETHVTMETLRSFCQSDDDLKTVLSHSKVFRDSLEALHHLQEVIWHRESGIVILNPEWMAKFMGDFVAPPKITQKTGAEVLQIEEGQILVTPHTREAIVAKHARLLMDIAEAEQLRTEIEGTEDDNQLFDSSIAQRFAAHTQSMIVESGMEVKEISQGLIDLLISFEVCHTMVDEKNRKMLLFPFMKEDGDIDFDFDDEDWTHRLGRRYYWEGRKIDRAIDQESESSPSSSSSSSSSSSPVDDESEQTMTKLIFPPAFVNILKIRISDQYNKDGTNEETSCRDFLWLEPNNAPIILLKHKINSTHIDVIVINDKMKNDLMFETLEVIEEMIDQLCSDRGQFPGMEGGVKSYPLCNRCLLKRGSTVIPSFKDVDQTCCVMKMTTRNMKKLERDENGGFCIFNEDPSSKKKALKRNTVGMLLFGNENTNWGASAKEEQEEKAETKMLKEITSLLRSFIVKYEQDNVKKQLQGILSQLEYNAEEQNDIKDAVEQVLDVVEENASSSEESSEYENRLKEILGEMEEKKKRDDQQE